MREYVFRTIMVVLLTAMAWACFRFAPQFFGSGLPSEFPVVLPLVLVIAVLSVASKAHERWKHRH